MAIPSEIKLSVTIITYNEEENIARCLSSVQELADEIVVVDSFSTDKTREIAERFPIRFIEHPFEGYVEQKNYALTKASSPYILSLDADEEVSAELKEEILSIKANWTYDGYVINRLSNCCGKWIRYGAWHPDHKVRLFDQRKGRWSGYNPHDHILMDKGTKTGKLKGKLFHYSYKSITQLVAKMNQYSSIQAAEYFRYGILPGGGKIIIHAVWRFFRDYFLKGGFLDGFYGFIIAMNSAHEAFLKYVKLKSLFEKATASQQERILFINTIQFWGGGEKWNLDIAKYLTEKNRNIFFIVTKKSVLEERLLKAKIPVLRLSRVFKGYLNPVHWIRISRLFTYFKPDKVICSLSNDLKILGPLAKMHGVHCVIFRRGIAVPVSDTMLNRFLYRSVVSKIVAVSTEAKRNILFHNSHLVPEDKISVIYNGIKINGNNEKKNKILYQRENRQEIVLGNAGRLSEEKDHLKFIDIAVHLKQMKIPFKMIIAGEGYMYAKLQQQIRKSGLQKEIELMGFIKNMEDFYASIDIFVLTSRHEGFGFVLLEAGIHKRPVVAFNIGSSAEIIVDGETGFLVPPENTQMMAQRIGELYNDPSLRTAMGEEAEKRVREHFDQQKSFASFARLLEQP